MNYHLDVMLTFDQKETLLKALDSITKRHPGSSMSEKALELKEHLKAHLERKE